MYCSFIEYTIIHRHKTNIVFSDFFIAFSDLQFFGLFICFVLLGFRALPEVRHTNHPTIHHFSVKTNKTKITRNAQTGYVGKQNNHRSNIGNAVQSSHVQPICGGRFHTVHFKDHYSLTNCTEY